MLLAGTLVKQLSAKGLYERLLDRTIQDLTIIPRPPQERHFSLNALIAVSYELLNEQEQTLFRRLGIFAGRCSIEAATIVCNLGDLPSHPAHAHLTNWFISLNAQHLIIFEQGQVKIAHKIIQIYAYQRLYEKDEEFGKTVIKYANFFYRLVIEYTAKAFYSELAGEITDKTLEECKERLYKEYNLENIEAVDEIVQQLRKMYLDAHPEALEYYEIDEATLDTLLKQAPFEIATVLDNGERRRFIVLEGENTPYPNYNLYKFFSTGIAPALGNLDLPGLKSPEEGS